jgi:hypothetical protein
MPLAVLGPAGVPLLFALLVGTLLVIADVCRLLLGVVEVIAVWIAFVFGHVDALREGIGLGFGDGAVVQPVSPLASSRITRRQVVSYVGRRHFTM